MLLFFQSLELMPVLLQHSAFHLQPEVISYSLYVGADLVFLVPGEGAAVDHVVQSEVGDLVEAGGGHVEADGAVE